MQTRNYSYTKDGNIDCEINHSVYGWVSFTASSSDSEIFGRDLYESLQALALEGKIEILEYYPPTTPSIEELASQIRLDRDYLLLKTDWTQLTDISDELKNMWAPYRQLLRNIPEQPGFPYNVDWPIPPK